MKFEKKILIALNSTHAAGQARLRGAMSYFRALRKWEVRIKWDYPGKEGSLEKELAWGPDGLLFEGTDPSHAAAVAAVPHCVACRPLAPGMPASIPVVAPDEEAVGALAAAYFLKRGYKNFAALLFPDAIFKSRGAGFAKALAKRQHECLLHTMDATLCARPEDYPFADVLAPALARPEPLCVLCANDVLAFHATRHLLARDVDIPERAAILGVDNDTNVNQLVFPDISSVEMPFEQVGYLAAKTLDGLIHGWPQPAETFLPPIGIATRRSSDTHAVRNPVVAKALNFIRSNADRDIEVADVMRVAGVSRRSLERAFKEELGSTPIAEMLSAHVRRAESLLRKTDLPIKRIAHESGFGSVLSFNRAFLKATGKTPRAYRKEVAAPAQDGTSAGVRRGSPQAPRSALPPPPPVSDLGREEKRHPTHQKPENEYGTSQNPTNSVETFE